MQGDEAVEMDESRREIMDAVRKALKKDAKVRDVVAVTKLLDEIQELDLKSEEGEPIADKLCACLCSPNFLKTEKSKKFLINIALKLLFRLSEVTLAIMESLVDLDEDTATSMGEIFINVWISANGTERAGMNVTLLKMVVEQGILSTSPTMNRNCRAFMDPFHAKKRKKGVAEALTHIYRPIIFMYLHAANHVVRQNAMIMFVNAFPLGSSTFSEEMRSELMQLQIQELDRALHDDSPRLRIAAAKAVCRVLYQWWDAFEGNVGNRRELIDCLTTELCFDQSSSPVRLAVLEGLGFLLGRAEAVDLIIPKIPEMSYLLHDPAESVRKQFVKLLTILNPLKQVDIFEIVHLDHLIYRLKNDTPKCALAICELLQPAIFPPLSEKGKQQKMKTTRVSRCIFLMKKNLAAAVKFYSLLPKLVSVEEILSLLSYAQFWAEKTATGQNIKLQQPKLKDGEDLVLPGFGDHDDLERQGLKPHEAIWAVISATMNAIAQKINDKDHLAEIYQKTFPNFDARTWLERLPPCLHTHLFKFVSVFQPTDDEIEMALDYLKSEENAAWSDALKCLVQWKALSTFFPELVDTVTTVVRDGGDAEALERLSHAITYLSFIFSNNDLRRYIINDDETISNLVYALEQFMVLLFLKLNIEFDRAATEVTDKSIEIAEQIPDRCYIESLELTIALRVHLSLDLLQANQVEPFTMAIRKIHNELFNPVTSGIFERCSAGELVPPNLGFLVTESLFTLVADMLSLHLFDELETFNEIVQVFTTAMDSRSEYGNDVKILAYRCMAKVLTCVSTDPVLKDGEHPANDMIKQMVENADNKESYQITKQIVETLVKQQQKNRNLPWLWKALYDMFTEIDENNEEEDDEEEDGSEERKNIQKNLRHIVNDAIVRITAN